MAIPASIMRRLTVARYLFQMGVEQSHRGEPVGALAISQLHDAVELFLQIGLEHNEAALNGSKDFLAFWSAFEAKGIELSRYEQMKRFNRARVGLKHDGTLPALSEVESFVAIVGGFLEENVPKLFGLKFSDISLSGLIKNDLVRRSLLLAEEAIQKGDCTTALQEAAKAFRRTLSEYRYGRLSEDSRQRLYEPAAELASAIGFDFSSFSEGAEKKLGKVLRRVVHDLGDAITVVAYNLDFDGYRYLRTYGPVVVEFANSEKIQVQWMKTPNTDIKIASRCVDFAVDASLKLQSRS